MFYERFLYLCNKNNISPSLAAIKSGFNKGTVSVWKKKFESGIDVRPEPTVISKICDYFECNESWLLGIDEEKPTVLADDGLTDSQKALIKLAQSLTDQEAEQILQTVKLILQGLRK